METNHSHLPVSTDDASLLQRYVKSPPERERAFGELVRRHLPLVLGAAWRRLNSRPLAEEAAMNAFTKLATKAKSGGVPADRLAAWLYRTASLEASNLARTEARFSRRLPPDVISLTESTEPDMNQPEIFEKLDEALQELAEVDRELVLRRYTFGETVREISAKIGKSEEACQKRLERALARLGAKLGTSAALITVLQNLAKTPAGAAEVALLRKITAGALARASEATGSAWWGTLAACGVASALAATLAWPKQATADTAGSISKPTVLVVAGKTPVAEAPLKPRPQAISRTLADVLDSIHCGRVLPLLEFLPQATVADLQAFLREDDMSGLSERSTGRRPTDRLVLARWVALDAAGAWKYALSRDKDNNGFTFPLAAYAFAVWAKQDATAAWNALAALSRSERKELAGALPDRDSALAEEMITRYPEVYWDLKEYGDTISNSPTVQARSRKSVDALLQGVDRGENVQRLEHALLMVNEGNLEAAIGQAMLIPDAGKREAVLSQLYQGNPRVDPQTLPLGKTRMEAFRSRYNNEDVPMPTDPQLQRVWLEEMGKKLAYTDPIRLLGLLAEAKPNAQKFNTYMPGKHGLTRGENWLETAVANAVKLDADKTRTVIPKIRTLISDANYKKLQQTLQQQN